MQVYIKKDKRMKKLLFLWALVVSVITIASCNNHETYADQLDRENNAINAYIVKSGINPISEEQFAKQNNTTDTTKNQYVLFASSGVYMQILEKGAGSIVQNSETARVLVRFSEYNILTDTIQLSNKNLYWSNIVDKMSVTNTQGTYTASFNSTSSLMTKAYGNTSVPSGWLVPMPYINIGRLINANDKLAHVKLIVPSQQGQAYATRGVYPCMYDITFQRGL